MSVNDYYVYTYSKPDGTVFYVGKGRGGRMKRHIAEVSNPNLANYNRVNTLKHNIIKKILREGDQPVATKVAEHLTEQEAFKLEAELIRKYGKIRDGTGILSNLTDGGEGTSGFPCTPERKRKMSEAKKGRLLSESHKLALKGVKRSEESCKQVSERQKKSIVQLSKGGTIIANWDSAVSASQQLHISQQNISECCRGKRKSAGGFIWKFM